jgi:hypothetical protein
MTIYRVISKSTLCELLSKVANLKRAGFIPLGDITRVNRRYSQTLIRSKFYEV